MKIAVDAMGGDHAPAEIIQGAVNAVAQNPAIEVILVGSEEAFATYLPNPGERITTVISQTVMAMDEPVDNLRKKKDSSIFMATELVADGTADALVSCGSTGAQMAAALLLLGRIKGVKRPAIVIPLPTLKGTKLMLDGGANADATAANMMDFALLGNAYARFTTGKTHPEVVLLANGTEAHKGNALVKETYALMSDCDFLNFRGNIEGRDILKGEYDVLVTDGFTGNVAMKATEGAAQALFSLIKQELTASATRKIGAALVKPGLKSIAKRFDYSTVGGVPLLGVKGISLVCHGSSKAQAVASAVAAAAEYVTEDFIGALAADMKAYRESEKNKEEA